MGFFVTHRAIVQERSRSFPSSSIHTTESYGLASTGLWNAAENRAANYCAHNSDFDIEKHRSGAFPPMTRSDERPIRTLREFLDWLQAAYDQINEWHRMPMEVVDDEVLRDVAGVVGEAASHATYFAIPSSVKPSEMMGTMRGLEAVGQLLEKARSRQLAESPYLDIGQAVRFLGARSERQIYSAIERGRITPLRFGKELRFTTEMLEKALKR